MCKLVWLVVKFDLTSKNISKGGGFMPGVKRHVKVKFDNREQHLAWLRRIKSKSGSNFHDVNQKIKRDKIRIVRK